MNGGDDEQELLRSVALQNAQSILLARERAEAELIRTKEALEHQSSELAHSLAMMRATLESTTDAILVTDAQGTITDFNEKFLEMWRMPRELIASREHGKLLDHICPRFADPAACRARIDAIYAASPPESFDILELSDGRVFERFSRIQYIEGQNVGRVWSLRDITERRRTEEALRDESRINARLLEQATRAAAERAGLLEAERKARAEVERVSIMKDEFLATLSHELRTPLNAILGWSEMLLKSESDPEDVKRGLETIARNARAQAQLIEDLLDMSRIVAGKVRLDVQRTDLAAVVEAAVDAVKLSADAKEIRLRKIIDPQAGPVFGDPNRLQQIVWNLLSNAVKFTSKGGKVDVRVGRVNSHIEITVIDSGPGISAEFLPHVFERFRQADASTTRKHGGLGLGLAIVKQLVELHGGTVRVESEGSGLGATFIVSLPLGAIRSDARREHPTAGGTAPLHEEVDLNGIKVLVIDDEPDARALITLVLTSANAEVICAASAAEGMELLAKEHPDLLLSDIGMPGKDGYQFIREVRSLPAPSGGKTPAIALTAFARSEDRTRALMAGYQIHIAKPIEPSELLATVASLSGRTAGEKGSP